jgi:hypothetical protein
MLPKKAARIKSVIDPEKAKAIREIRNGMKNPVKRGSNSIRLCCRYFLMLFRNV